MGPNLRITGPLQQTLLIVLRTLIGWHFLCEGYTKLLQPAWGRLGAPVGRVVVGRVSQGSDGPLAEQFHWLGNASWIGTLDLVVASALVAVGLSLMLGLFTQTGCLGALGLLSMFYLSAIPMGLPETRAEGTYLIVNKNLIEAAADWCCGLRVGPGWGWGLCSSASAARAARCSATSIRRSPRCARSATSIRTQPEAADEVLARTWHRRRAITPTGRRCSRRKTSRR